MPYMSDSSDGKLMGWAMTSDDDAFQGMLLELADPWTCRDDDGGERLIWTAYCGMNMEIFRVPYLFN